MYFKDKKTPQKERFVYNRGALRGKKKSVPLKQKAHYFLMQYPVRRGRPQHRAAEGETSPSSIL